ncbi:MAG: hypothetical protein H7Z76_03845 [Methylotenera sp.]|nr:hypothetical protein [Flavobacterium sp.]
MKRQEKRTDYVNINLRIPLSTYKQLKLFADKEGKSRLFYIFEAIEQSFKKELKA